MGSAAVNRICRLLGLATLLAAVGIAHLRAPIFGDFVQFHMAGLVARAGAWDALYPIPIPGSVHNAGSSKDSTAKRQADEIARVNGIDAVPYHFMLPPPVALLCWPLGFFEQHTAHRLWLVASVLAAWITAWQAGLIFCRCAGRESRWSGLISLLICIMPPTHRAVVVSNLTPFIAALIGWAVLVFMDSDETEMGGAFALTMAFFLKYAAIAFFPILLVQRRWRVVIWMAGMGLAMTLVSIGIMGISPWIEFALRIAPTLVRAHEMDDNISLAGILLHALRSLPPLPQRLEAVISAGRLLLFGMILLPMFRLGARGMRQPHAVCAAATALLSWMLIFSPVAWSHYLIYLCPLWGWLVWRGGQDRVRGAVAWLAMALVIFSPEQMPAPEFDRWGLHLLGSLGLMLILGIDALRQLAREAQVRSSQDQVVSMDHFIVRGVGEHRPYLGGLLPGDPLHV